MANEKVNKVVLGNETLIDLTGDTVSANNLLVGATAHDSRGEQIQGNVSVPTVLDDLSDVTITSASDDDQLINKNGSWINKKLMVTLTQAEYDQLVEDEEVDPDVEYHISNGILSPAIVDDNDVSLEKTWSSEKVNDIFTWKLLGSRTGNVSLELPTDNYQELYVEISTANNYFSNVIKSGTVNDQVFIGGYFALASSSSSCALCEMTSTAITANQIYVNGSNVTSSAVMTVYYR